MKTILDSVIIGFMGVSGVEMIVLLFIIGIIVAIIGIIVAIISIFKFKGNSSVSFKSSKTKADVIKVVEKQFEVLGNISVSSSGGINVKGSKFTGFGYKTNIQGRVSDNNGKFSVSIDFQAKLEFAGFALAICLFPIGLLVLILPNNAKGDMQRKSEQALTEIKSILNEK